MIVSTAIKGAGPELPSLDSAKLHFGNLWPIVNMEALTLLLTWKFKAGIEVATEASTEEFHTDLITYGLGNTQEILKPKASH